MTKGSSKKLLLIGWDAADWKVISPLMDEGKMPNMERFVDEGVMGNIATLYPELSPMLWTSIATGKRPFKHGIYGFSEPTPDGAGIRPITIMSRSTKAIWNILSQEGFKSNVIGWWPSHPAEPINGVMVSNHYQRAWDKIDEPWPLQPGTVHPRRLTDALASQRVHPMELETTDIGPFLPKIAEIDQEKDHRVETLAKTLAETASIHSAATAVMQLEPWDFMAVYYDGIDHFSHQCMQYHPPRLPWVGEKDFELYKDVITSAYRFHDMMLGAMMALAGDDTTIIIVSDHGFHSDHLRAPHIPLEPAGPAAQHRNYGIFAMRGPGIRADERVYGVSLLDICPTALTVMGLPVGDDMDGTVVVNAFQTPPTIETVPSWDDVPGEAGMHPRDAQIDPVEAQEAINQLVALGYIDKPDDNIEKAVAETVRELNYNLARSYMDANLHIEAVPYLEELVDDWPDEHRFGIRLVACYEALGRIRQARELLETLLAHKDEVAAKSQEELKEWLKEHEDADPDDVSDEEKTTLRRLRARAGKSPYAMNYMLGSLLFAEGNANEALACLRKAEAANTTRPNLYAKIGDVYTQMGRLNDAERAFDRALELDPEHSVAHSGMAGVCLRQRRNADAAEEALRSVALIYHNPYAHFQLGVALHRLNNLDRAIEALNVAVSQNPNYIKAHRRLAYIYRRRLKDPDKATEHGNCAVQARKRIVKLRKAKGLPVPQRFGEESTDTPPAGELAEAGKITTQTDPAKIITVVSGLPRSGTSMMMQMLQAAGLSPLVDDNRPEDEDNPRGYFEFEPVKNTMRNSSWIPKAQGKSVKVIAQLLPYLPRTYTYKVVFMHRDIDEILASQKTMLNRTGRKGTDMDDEQLARVFRKQLDRVQRTAANRPNVSVLNVRHRDAINDPLACAKKVAEFLDGDHDPEAMAAAVDPKLYRQRKEP